MARQEVSRTTHIEEGELRVTHENAILTNITGDRGGGGGGIALPFLKFGSVESKILATQNNFRAGFDSLKIFVIC